MEASDSISFIYCLDEHEGEWQHHVSRELCKHEAETRRTETLRAHVEAARKLRHAIEQHEQCTRVRWPALPDTSPVTPRQSLRYVISGIEHAQQQERPRAAQTADIWNGLYTGTWTVVDHYEQHGRRYFFLYNTDVGELDPLRMTPLQRGTLTCLSRGFGDAEIAAELRTKLDAASALVRTVKKKLRIPARRDLVGLNEGCLRTIRLEFAGLACALLYSSTTLTEVLPITISAAEREILHLQLAGKSNNEIAQIRRVKYKTVSNQVAAAYSKLNVRTCGEMLYNVRAACR